MGALRSFRYANITATLALLFSLAGTGTAAVLTPDHHQSSLSPTSVRSAAAAKKSSGKVAASLRLAGYAEMAQQTLPDDAAFHSAWSLNFKAENDQLFILAGGYGSASTPGCPSGDSIYSERILIDGNVSYEHDSNGTTTGTQPGAFLNLARGQHTISYDYRGDCPGFPVQVGAQQVALIPFSRP